MYNVTTFQIPSFTFIIILFRFCNSLKRLPLTHPRSRPLYFVRTRYYSANEKTYVRKIYSFRRERTERSLFGHIRNKLIVELKLYNNTYINICIIADKNVLRIFFSSTVGVLYRIAAVRKVLRVSVVRIRLNNGFVFVSNETKLSHPPMFIVK